MPRTGTPIKAFNVCPRHVRLLEGCAWYVDPACDRYYLRLMIMFAHTLRLRLPVVPTAGSTILLAK